MLLLRANHELSTTNNPPTTVPTKRDLLMAAFAMRMDSTWYAAFCLSTRSVIEIC